MNYPHFSQADPRWGVRVLGRNRTIKQAGCAMTACAMYASGRLGRDVTPLELDKWLDERSGYSGDGIEWVKVAKFMNQQGASFKENIELTDVRGVKLTSVYWRHPGACVLRVTGTTVREYHYVLLLNSSGACHDPGTRNGANTTLDAQQYKADRITWYVPDKVMTIWDAQIVLRRHEMYLGRIDGVYGPKTKVGIESFQSKFGLSKTGVLDDVTVQKMLEVLHL